MDMDARVREPVPGGGGRGSPGRSLREKQTCPKTAVLQKDRVQLICSTMLNHGWWRLVIGGWWVVAVGDWWLVGVGGWRLAVGGCWLVVPGGGPSQIVFFRVPSGPPLVKPNSGALSEGAGGTFGRRTLSNTTPSQRLLNGTRSKAHVFKRARE